MTNRIVQALIDEVRERVPRGVRPRGVMGALSVWTRPPLITGARLGLVELDQVNAPRSTLGAYELADAYEEFIHGYLLGDDLVHRRPYDWVRRNLGLTQAEGMRVAPIKLLCPPHPKARPEDWLVVLLWCIHKCIKDSQLTVEGKSMVLTLEDKVIGIRDGVLLSSYSPHKALDYAPDFSLLLYQASIGTRVPCRREALNRYYTEAGKQPDGELLQLAIRVLYWRFNDSERVEDRLYGGETKWRGNRLIATIRHNMFHAENPRMYLMSILVPRYTSATDFKANFGNPYRKYVQRPRAEVIEQWLLSVESIMIEAEENQ
jgi:hypothetical protein